MTFTIEAILKLGVILVIFLLSFWLAKIAQAQDFESANSALRYLHQVATHPRCTNCHGTINNENQHIPTVGDSRHPHAMNIQSRFALLGAKCTSCHQQQNLLPPLPPGAAEDSMPGFLWHMPAASMIINPGVTPAQLCEQWLDRAHNGVEINRGGRNDMATFKREFQHHADADPLVHWAFKPGDGRTPAPGSKEKFSAAMRVWLAANAPCE